ncbi:hypothetical protein HZH66_003061 [Vespula vulgaris]|uniref:Uncharacterized protein n=1 Tax=Vespula vulgaris TaxID=7454 RepID=A0A836UY52_VESVU|nr:hypothetical protein HZH66_003061 [Vespula vulgaris]
MSTAKATHRKVECKISKLICHPARLHPPMRKSISIRGRWLIPMATWSPRASPVRLSIILENVQPQG